jgi:acetaldehyde dehydrogenase
VGSGNIGTDLLAKLIRSSALEARYMVGIDPDSEGLRRAAMLDVETSAGGIDWLLSRPEPPDIVFEATSAAIHRTHATRYRDMGVRAIDLTPAAVGPYVVPSVNLGEHLDADNVNLITCGGQATIPIVHAVSRVTETPYAEIVATVASRSAGPGTRANIDEFTKTTALGVEQIGGARRGKAIIILNPAEPPMIMRNTVFCAVGAECDDDEIVRSIETMVRDVASYVPGYRLLTEPQIDAVPGGGRRVAVFLEVEGAGEFLPPYAGNLDIMTAAAVRVGEDMSKHLSGALVS